MSKRPESDRRGRILDAAEHAFADWYGVPYLLQDLSFIDRACSRFTDTWKKGKNELIFSGYSWHTPWTWTKERRDEENPWAWGGGYGRSFRFLFEFMEGAKKFIQAPHCFGRWDVGWRGPDQGLTIQRAMTFRML